ncbi:MAG TPA: alpha/beta hydrolase [Acidimicrobiia bacterium]
MAERRRWVRWLSWVSAFLGGLLLLGPFLLPLPELDTIPPRELAEPGDRFVTLEGIDVRYRVAGADGPTILLLHGFGANSRSWEPVMATLAEIGRVVAFDRVGFGLTERPLEWEGDNPYGSPAQLELVVALMDDLGVETGILVGHSAGAEVAAAVTLAHPDRISGLVLESPALDSGPGPIVRALAATPQGQRVVRFTGRKASDQVYELLASAYHDPSRITPETLDGYQQPFRADDWDIGLAHLVASPRLGSLRDRLTEAKHPLLILTGGEDTWVPTADTVELAGGLPEAELVVVPNCGHVAHEECPTAFGEAVSEWLEDRTGDVESSS